MKAKRILGAAVFITLTTTITTASAQQVLTGDTKLACEALLCLSASTNPSECFPSLSRYFSISFRKWSDTVRGRIDFLNLCPTANADTNMQSLVRAIGAGAGNCSVSSLNSSLSSGGDSGSVIDNTMPSYCVAYLKNPYVDLAANTPLYVGIPSRGGYWVDPANYNQALAAYNARIAAEDAASQNSSN